MIFFADYCDFFGIKDTNSKKPKPVDESRA